MRDRNGWLALGFVVAVSVVFHAVVLRRPINAGADGPSYIVPALELVRHHRFNGSNPIVYSYPVPGNERFGPETVRTPGYPLFLAAVMAAGLPLSAAVWIQHLIGVALAAAVFLFCEIALRRRGAAIVAALLIGTQPAILLLAHNYMSEVLFTAIATAALFCTYRVLRGAGAGWAAAAGIVAGSAALIRPIALVAFLPLAAIVVWRAPRRAAAAFLIAALLLPVAWTARNHARVGVATLSSGPAENVLLCNAAAALVIADKPLLFRISALQRNSGFYQPWEVMKRRVGDATLAEMRAANIDPQRVPHAVIARYYSAAARRIVMRHLAESAELAVSGVIEMFVYTWARPASSTSPLVWLTIAVGVAVFLAACRGVAVLWRDDPIPALLLATTIAALALPAASAAADIRFAIPFAPLYAIAAALGITERAPAATAATAPHK